MGILLEKRVVRVSQWIKYGHRGNANFDPPREVRDKNVCEPAK